LFAGFWLTACTYPIVVLVLPALFDLQNNPSRYTSFLIVAETFAPVAECLIFWFMFGSAQPTSRNSTIQDMVVIILANLASFGAGVVMEEMGWWQHLGLKPAA
jgi:hypothetical protein